MVQIVISDEQARVIATADDRVQVRDSQGNVVGYISPPFTAEEVAEAERDLESDQPRYTTKQVFDYLNSLEAR